MKGVDAFGTLIDVPTDTLVGVQSDALFQRLKFRFECALGFLDGNPNLFLSLRAFRRDHVAENVRAIVRNHLADAIMKGVALLLEHGSAPLLKMRFDARVDPAHPLLRLGRYLLLSAMVLSGLCFARALLGFPCFGNLAHSPVYGIFGQRAAGGNGAC